MILVKEEQLKMQENLKNVSDDATYQRLLEKVTKCFKKNIRTTIIAVAIGVALGVVAAYHFYKYCPTYINDFWILKILFHCMVIFVVVIPNLFAQFIGVILSKRRMGDEELLYLNGVLLQNAVCKKQDNNSISINNNGVFCSGPDGKIVRICKDIPENIEVIIKEYYQLTEWCVATSVREYQVYGNDKLINKIIKY